MAVTVTERPESRRHTENVSAELVYTIEGTNQSETAINNLKSTASTTFNGLVRKEPTVEPAQGCSMEDNDSAVWIGRVPYAKATTLTLAASEEERLEFGFGGGTKRQTQAKSQTTYVASGTAPDFKGAIGVTEDGVEGIDIDASAAEFTIMKVVPKTDVDATYITTLRNMVNKVNNATFRGAAAGTVRVTRITGAERDDDDYELRFSFQYIPNETSIAVGDITVTSKQGHQALWAQYAEDEDQGMIVRRPISASVATVYDSGDFSTLGIATT